jgi:hypothetical protein
MEFEQARDQANRTGGLVQWSEEKGWYVEPEYQAESAPWFQYQPLWPWQTVAGEGFMAPWGQRYQAPSGRATRYQQGMPQLSWTAAQKLQELGYPQEEWNLEVATPTATEMEAYQQSQADEALGATLGEELGGLGNFVRLEEMNGYLVPVYLDADGKEYMEWTEAAPMRETEEPRTYEPYAKGGAYEGWTFNPYSGEYEAPPDYVSPYQKEQLRLAKRQMLMEQEQWEQQQEAEKQQRLAELSANPMSWLQYGLESDLGSQVQPWMVPLSQGSMTTGQQLTSGQETNLTGLPELTTPSAQYAARMTPSAQQQWFGYEKARTGATPEDVQKRLWMRSAPSGSFPGLTYARR